ncbi:ETX/MTX2 family pore-forming toxin [Bacillus toyonensis]|uniref:ETX/MTX2 family pore-forming toxin n=1 Tax=Bacillus toyonensis TaxID=155322 RepID=UPI0015CF3214|nr:ETX/MTX2 family pore-forming toxin [Bacillus toyonensis]
MLQNETTDLLSGKTHFYVNDGTTITGDVSNFVSDSAMPNLNNYAKAIPLVAFDNTFTNNSTVTQTYMTPEIVKTHSDSKSTSVSNGFTLGAKATASVSGKVDVPLLAEGSATASVEFSAQYQFNTTTTSTSTETVTLRIPPQPVVVPAGKKTHVKIYYAAINITNAPITYTGKMSGMVTIEPNNVPNFPSGSVDLYSVLSVANEHCPNAAVNGNTGLTLDSTNKSVNFTSTGYFNGELLAGNFFVQTDEQSISASTENNSEHSVKITQGDLIITPDPDSPTNMRTHIYVCNCPECGCEN